MKVLAVVPYADTYQNRFHFAYRQMDALKGLGVEVEIFDLKSRFNPLGLLKEYLRFLTVTRNFRPDVVHAHFGSITSFFIIFNFRPKVVCFRGSDINHNPSVSFLRGKISHFLSHLSTVFAGRVLSVSEEIRSKLLCSDEKIVIVPDGINEAEFFPKSRKECRKKLGLDPNEKIILFNAGSNHRIKRFDLAESVIKEVRKDFPDLNFTVFKGDVAAELIPDYMNAADVILMTSDSEGSPVVVKEAAACGLPVVSFDVGDVRRILSDRSRSHVVSHRNLDEMIVHTKRFLQRNAEDVRTSYLPRAYRSAEISRLILGQYQAVTHGR